MLKRQNALYQVPKESRNSNMINVLSPNPCIVVITAHKMNEYDSLICSKNMNRAIIGAVFGDTIRSCVASLCYIIVSFSLFLSYNNYRVMIAFVEEDEESVNNNIDVFFGKNSPCFFYVYNMCI